MAEPTNWGCAAVGRRGCAAIDVDEALTGPVRWQMSVDLPGFHLRFAISGAVAVARLCEFLERRRNPTTSDELEVGTIGRCVVSIIKDDEFVDRFYLSVADEAGVVQQTLGEDEVADLIGALRQATDDLDGKP